MAHLIGETFHRSSTFDGEWIIPEFLSLPRAMPRDNRYCSGPFIFSAACWELELCPNGTFMTQSEGHIELYLRREDSGPPLTLEFSLGIRKIDGTVEIALPLCTRTYRKTVKNSGCTTYLRWSDLLDRRAVLAPSDVLTITYTLKVLRLHSMKGKPHSY